jgi:glucose-1-phosphate thymidylyltransferase
MRREDGSVHLDAQEEAVADTGVKALIPIERPFLDYVLHVLVEAGYRRVCLVIGPEHDELRDYYGRQVNSTRLKFCFAIQDEPLGTANALLSAQEFADGDAFLMINSDNYYPVEACRGLRQISGSGVAVFERDSMLRGSNIPAERLTRFALVQIGEDGNLTRIIEKPDEQTLGSMAEPICLSMNIWRFQVGIFEACRKVKLSRRGEYELPDAVQLAIDRWGEKFRVLTYHAPVLDLSSRSDIASVKAKLAGMKVDL